MSKRDDPQFKQRQRNAALLMRTCVTCDFFDEDTEQCRKWNARPPAKVIAYGCDQYLEEIPF